MTNLVIHPPNEAGSSSLPLGKKHPGYQVINSIRRNAWHQKTTDALNPSSHPPENPTKTAEKKDPFKTWSG
jgi:hypothetical protein